MRENIINALNVLGLSKRQFCKEYGVEYTNFCAFLRGQNTLSVQKVEQILKTLSERVNALKRWQVSITLSNGNEANVRISAADGEAAFRRVLEQPEFCKFAAGCTILRYKYTEIGKYKINSENFLLQQSKNDGWWVVTDLRFNIVVKFEKGHFDNQKNTVLFTDNLSEIDIATSLREIGEFIYECHSDLLN